MSYHLRTRALHGDMRRYRCCGGYHPCVGRCGEESCPECCLATEVCLCFASSVLSTRFMLQDEMQVGNSRCDDALICFVIACEWAACILSLIDDEAAAIAHNASDAVYISVCACMQTQHKLQLDARDEGRVPTFTTTTAITMNPPPAQQMVMMPSQGYAPQQPPMAYGGYAQQPGYAPQQQAVYYAPPGGFQPQAGPPGYYAQQPMAMGPQPGVVYNPMMAQQQQMYR